MTGYASVTAKIQRTASQIDVLKVEMDAFCAEIKRAIVHEIDQDADTQAWIYRETAPDVPIEWSVSVGEILYNLRSALDHLVWQLVLANGSQPGSRTEFPIVKDPTGWEAAANRRLEGIGGGAKDRIQRLQPYTGGYGLDLDVGSFWTLHNLCNIDKHRHLNLCAVATSGPGPIVFGENQPPRRESAEPLQGTGSIGKISPGVVLLQLDDHQQEIYPDFRIEVRLDYPQEPELVAGTVSQILSECVRAVQGAYHLLAFGTTSF